jgi:hypothetical protein
LGVLGIVMIAAAVLPAASRSEPGGVVSAPEEADAVVDVGSGAAPAMELPD